MFLLPVHRRSHLGFKQVKFNTTAEILVDILDMVDFKKGTSTLHLKGPRLFFPSFDLSDM